MSDTSTRFIESASAFLTAFKSAPTATARVASLASVPPVPSGAWRDALSEALAVARSSGLDWVVKRVESRLRATDGLCAAPGPDDLLSCPTCGLTFPRAAGFGGLRGEERGERSAAEVRDDQGKARFRQASCKACRADSAAWGKVAQRHGYKGLRDPKRKADGFDPRAVLPPWYLRADADRVRVKQSGGVG